MLLPIMILVFAIGIFVYLMLLVGYVAYKIIFLILKLVSNVIRNHLLMRRTRRQSEKNGRVG
ncbi:unnamed protein product [Fructobacillus cardui]|nr:unnamed protein product [Fructobacillus cardui]